MGTPLSANMLSGPSPPARQVVVGIQCVQPMPHPSEGFCHMDDRSFWAGCVSHAHFPPGKKSMFACTETQKRLPLEPPLRPNRVSGITKLPVPLSVPVTTCVFLVRPGKPCAFL